MGRTYSSEQLEPIEYYPQADGMAVVILRENIEQDEQPGIDGGTVSFWVADEVQTTTDLDEEDIAENFDTLWVKAEAESKTIEERLTEIEELQDAIMMAIIEGSEL